MRRNHLGDDDLLWFASGFRTVEMWQYSMQAHGYGVPREVVNGLRVAIERLGLTFPEASRVRGGSRRTRPHWTGCGSGILPTKSSGTSAPTCSTSASAILFDCPDFSRKVPVLIL